MVVEGGLELRGGKGGALVVVQGRGGGDFLIFVFGCYCEILPE